MTTIIAMKSGAFKAKAAGAMPPFGKAIAIVMLLCSVVACSGLRAPSHTQAYDFGLQRAAVAAQAQTPSTPLPPIVLAAVEAGSALDGTAMLYRLAYSNSQQLRPYAQARWAMPPAELLRLRLRDTLGQQRVVLQPAEGAGSVWVLRLELEEFSQVFNTVTDSAGWVRARATVVESTGRADRLVAQKTFVLQQPSGTPDASGGAHALAQASDQLCSALAQWLLQLPSAATTGALPTTLP